MDLRTKDLSLDLGGRRILEGVSIQATAGEVTAIVGPNGSGKTSLLKCLTGEYRYSGTISLNGADINSYAPAELALWRAVLPQAIELSFPFTVHEVVSLALTSGVAMDKGRASDDLVQRALERVGLGGYAPRRYQTLSGGEQQRVQLARVLLQVWESTLYDLPRWLFLDEPVSALDIAHQLLVIDIAQDFARKGGGVIAVMHDLNLTSMFADQVLLMQGGQVAASGAAEEVLADEPLSRAYGCAVVTRQAPATGAWLLPQVANGRAFAP
ncbi:heme ABC transporter ATP-binding protein [Donghicola sp. XS_ASV15]|uniref:heme ABC transporter ATP-binding protein n=1 Tax=Donghicola sp. XS_ASV15 TaxID=3241295 RepID=UPI0035126D10